MGYRYRGSNLMLDQPFIDIEGKQYPKNWLRLSTEKARNDIPGGGITWEPDPKPWPD